MLGVQVCANMTAGIRQFIKTYACDNTLYIRVPCEDGHIMWYEVMDPDYVKGFPAYDDVVTFEDGGMIHPTDMKEFKMPLLELQQMLLKIAVTFESLYGHHAKAGEPIERTSHEKYFDKMHGVAYKNARERNCLIMARRIRAILREEN